MSTHRKLRNWVIDPSSTFYYRWLAVISFACLYNLTMVIARSVFWKLQEQYTLTWLVLDYLCDAIYLLDMFVQFRTGRTNKHSILCLNIWPFYSQKMHTVIYGVLYWLQEHFCNKLVIFSKKNMYSIFCSFCGCNFNTVKCISVSYIFA